MSFCLLCTQSISLKPKTACNKVQTDMKVETWGVYFGVMGQGRERRNSDRGKEMGRGKMGKFLCLPNFPEGGP